MRSRGPLGAAALLLALTGCSGDAEAPTLRVYAAASLAATFEEIATLFEADHDGVEVELVLGGSSDLAAQIGEGAPADVFAAADEPTMGTLVEEDLATGTPEVFATNALEIAVSPGNPADVRSVADLARPGLRLVLCAPEVPCGAAAARAARAAGVALEPVSEEQSVSDVLGKVRSGEADAGLVYVTDVLAAGGAVAGVDVPAPGAAANRYPIVPVAGSAEPDLAAAFRDLVLGPEGQRVLRAAGFAPAP
ncbi:molybdate ABC transporter substrate-binding protein [Nocardioides pantholopis]|uniref:molybdate ABC transporter substrate-binding protein n=1 Tax=Nocardioides pantholopis TaxID=2483798 RepID=UPI000FDBEC0C|nr:molybdate ABC transporter substrate-binding protein [Nocardioides pantholopis]